jgi:hypothetical protein
MENALTCHEADFVSSVFSNPDRATPSNLEEVLEVIGDEGSSDKADRLLGVALAMFPSRFKPPEQETDFADVETVAQLHHYCRARLGEIRARKSGRKAEAARLDAHCEEVYATLPTYARWRSERDGNP